jgi:hypothetical protein
MKNPLSLAQPCAIERTLPSRERPNWHRRRFHVAQASWFRRDDEHLAAGHGSRRLARDKRALRNPNRRHGLRAEFLRRSSGLRP